jgi:hypothetical protein
MNIRMTLESGNCLNIDLNDSNPLEHGQVSADHGSINVPYALPKSVDLFAYPVPQTSMLDTGNDVSPHVPSRPDHTHKFKDLG